MQILASSLLEAIGQLSCARHAAPTAPSTSRTRSRSLPTLRGLGAPRQTRRSSPASGHRAPRVSGVPVAALLQTCRHLQRRQRLLPPLRERPRLPADLHFPGRAARHAKPAQPLHGHGSAYDGSSVHLTPGGASGGAAGDGANGGTYVQGDVIVGPTTFYTRAYANASFPPGTVRHCTQERGARR